MRRSSREGGQASVEYAAVVALVALVLTAASVTGGSALAGAVMDGLRRALCVVSGAGCSLRANPCVLSTAATDERAGADIVLIRIGRHAGILRQQRSDGSFAITEIDDLEGGLRVGLGAHGRLRLGKLALGLGGELQAALLAELGHGRTFIVHSRAAADRLVEKLVHGSPATMLLDLPIRVARGVLGLGRGGIPEPDEVYFEGGLRGLLSAGLGTLASSLELVAATGMTVGGRVEKRTGRRTLYFRLARGVAAPLVTAIGSVEKSDDRTLLGGVVFDRTGRPVELTLSGTTRVLSGASSPIAELLRRVGAGDVAKAGSRYEFDARLDLTDPENAQAARAFLVALAGAGGPEALADSGRRLAERMRTDAHLDARVYDVNSAALGIDAGIALGVRAGGEFSFERTAARLVAAVSRPPGAWWEKRFDCGMI